MPVEPAAWRSYRAGALEGISFERDYAVFAPAGTGKLRAAAGRVDITPRLGLPAGGHGFSLSDVVGTHGPHETTNAVWGRLFASILALEDAGGSRACLIAADLHAGSRYVVENIARGVAPSTGISIDRLFFGVSHTHGGPGHIYGSSFYDDFAAHAHGLDRTTADEIVEAIATEIERLFDDDVLAPAELAYGTAPLWGSVWNRSQKPALANEGEPHDMSRARVRKVSRELGRHASFLEDDKNPPSHAFGKRLFSPKHCVDARMQVLVAQRKDDGTTMGAFALCHATPTSSPRTLPPTGSTRCGTRRWSRAMCSRWSIWRGMQAGTEQVRQGLEKFPL